MRRALIAFGFAMLSPSGARADLAGATARETPLPAACVAAIREVARGLGLGHVEEGIGDDAVEPDFDRADSRWSHDFRVNPT
jgi:hypothetical protein